jgi:predicted transposase/invertase (TIGR01784 family)
MPVQFDKEADILDIRFDEAFKAVFTRNTPQSRGALKGLLSCLIRREISSLSITANEPPSNFPGDRQIRFDINCVFNDGELADIEMTLTPHASEPLRLEFYTSRLFITQDIHGNSRSYRDLKLTYQISILNRNLFADDVLVHRFEYYDAEHNLSLGGKTRIITVELAKAEAIAAGKTVEGMSAEERWAIFLCYGAQKGRRELVNAILAHEEAIAMAGETMVGFTKEQIAWFRNESKIKYELDMRETIAEAQDAAREEGHKEGHKEGREEGREEGHKQGQEEGIAIGETRMAEKNREEKLQSARNLRQMGLSDEQIAFALGLGPEDLKDQP